MNSSTNTCEVFFANPFALWSTAVVATKFVLITHCGRLVKCNNSETELSEFLKNFDLLESTVFTPLYQVYYEMYESKWMKDTMQGRECTLEEEVIEIFNDDIEFRSKNTYEYTQWEKLVEQFSPHSADPIDPFDHFARCVIKINTYMLSAMSTTSLGSKTLAKIRTWINYMQQLKSKHCACGYFSSTLHSDFFSGLRELKNKTTQQLNTPPINGDEYSFFSPGVLLIRVLSSVYIGQDRTNFRHPKYAIWSNQSANILSAMILGETPQNLLINADQYSAFQFPFIGSLPLTLIGNSVVMEKKHAYLENVFEAIINYFTEMSVKCQHNPNSQNRSNHVLSEMQLVSRDILSGIFPNTLENTRLRKVRNFSKAKTSKSETKKADKNRTKPYRPRFPTDALHKNKYVFGHDTLQVICDCIPKSRVSFSNVSSCPVRPTRDDLPDECV